jgi:serine/threonine protein kinase
MQVTMTGEIIGTPVFMSPEQCRGDPIDGRTDLYSLGATLYMVLSGEPPFRGENTAVLLQKVLNDRPAPLPSLVPGIPEGVTALVQRLMAKYPVARFQTGREVVEGITDILVGRFHFAGETRSDDPETGAEPVSLLRWAGLCLLGVALGVVCYVLQPAEETRAATKPRPSPPVATREPEPPSRIVPPSEPPSGRMPLTRSLPQGPPVSDPELKRGILKLRNRLASGNIEECLECFHPDFRMDSQLRLSLGRFLQALEVQELGPGPQLAQQQGPDSATAILLFRHESKPVSLGLPVEWQRQNGEWYARPMNRTPALGQ